MIGSAVGGIIGQIAEGTGLLLPDPAGRRAFGTAVRILLGDQVETARRGLAAHAYVRENYLGDIHLMRYQAARHAYRGWLAVKAMPFRHAAQPPRRIPRTHRGLVSPTNGQQVINAMTAALGDHDFYLELLCRGGRV